MAASGGYLLLASRSCPPWPRCRIGPWTVDTIRGLVVPEDAFVWTPALRTLETTWLQFMQAGPTLSLSLANPGCGNYMLGVLDDAAAADRQLDRAAGLAQLVSLSRSADLIAPPSGVSAAARTELANVLTSRRADVLEKLRRFTLADLADVPSADRRVGILLDVAAVLKALGTAEDTAWLFQLSEALTEQTTRKG